MSTPEINITVADADKFAMVETLAREGDFGEGIKTTLDGIRVDYPDGWGLCRASNTTPALVLRFEGKTARPWNGYASASHSPCKVFHLR